MTRFVVEKQEYYGETFFHVIDTEIHECLYETMEKRSAQHFALLLENALNNDAEDC